MSHPLLLSVIERLQSGKAILSNKDLAVLLTVKDDFVSNKSLLTFSNGCDRMNMCKSMRAYLGGFEEAKLEVCRC